MGAQLAMFAEPTAMPAVDADQASLALLKVAYLELDKAGAFGALPAKARACILTAFYGCPDACEAVRAIVEERDHFRKLFDHIVETWTPPDGWKLPEEFR